MPRSLGRPWGRVKAVKKFLTQLNARSGTRLSRYQSLTPLAVPPTCSPLDFLYCLQQYCSSMRVNSALKRLRKQRGLTQIELAERAKVGQPYLAQLESGFKTNPSLVVLARLAKGLRVKVATLLEDS